MRTLLAHLLLLFTVMASVTTAHAATWPGLPVACTPERAAPWQEGRSEEKQAACHCPPPNMCPTYEEIIDPSKARISPIFAARCCTRPLCPAGTDFAGQTVPLDNECNLPRCPSGTILAGEVVPQDGNCNPESTGEPMCHACYVGPMGFNQEDNDICCDGDGQALECTLWQQAGPGGLAVKMGLSDNSRPVHQWQWKTCRCVAQDSCRRPVAGCPAQHYAMRPATADYPSGYAVLGVKYFTPAQLPNNLASDAVMNAFGTNTSKVIGKANPANSGIKGAIVGHYWRQRNTDRVIESEAAGFLQVCRGAMTNPDDHFDYVQMESVGKRITVPNSSAFGTQIGLASYDINGQSCKYLTCAFVLTPNEETTCVTGSTKVTLADGTEKIASELRVGDVVKGATGNHAILATNRYEQSHRDIYGLNGSGAMISDFHPIKTTKGWKVINSDLAASLADKPGYASEALKVGDVLVTQAGEVPLKELKLYPQDKPVYTYNIKLEDDGSFYANGIEVKGFDTMEMHYR